MNRKAIKTMGENSNMRIVLLFLIFSIFLLPSTRSQDEQHIYSTWDVLEIDGCASAWLIKTHVDSLAEFRFYSKGEFIMEGIAFDTPDAKMRRMAAKSCYETVLEEYQISDKVLVAIGKMIHDIEVNFWAEGASQKAQELNQNILKIIDSSKTPGEAFEKSCPVFDDLYQQLKSELE
jgi:hypothetical protein